MGKKNFQPEKSFKDVGSAAATFNSAVSTSNSKGSISANATADPWAKHVNQIGWESEAGKCDDPNWTPG